MADENLDFKNLPFHIPYEGIHREAYECFHTQSNEPFRFVDGKFNQRFGVVNHKIGFWTDPTVNFPRSLSSLRSKDIHGVYEFREKFTNPNLMFIGSSMMDGTIVARMKYYYSDRLTMKNHSQINDDKTFQTMFSIDYKRANFISQLQVGTNIPVKASYSESVTPELSLHTEVSWNVNGKTDASLAARYEAKNPKMVAIAQVSTSTRCVIMSCFQKISREVSFVTYHMYNYVSRVGRSRFGCVYSWRQGRVLANIDSNGVFAAHLEERLVKGLSVIYSAELDTRRKERKFGCGIVLTG
ncbi:Mitochondrial import receptor subunit TOM40-1 [Cardamine amara subsp. amara]|uniref:Mitochondrial import receptor subunit TOM40-1 n=1 Tax=Cardamine amara subsp. amara TaxID=228776 RepID=A0ABD1AQ09_CARAN